MKAPALFWTEAKFPEYNQWTYHGVYDNEDDAFKHMDSEIEEGSSLDWRVVRVDRTVIVREDGE